MKEGALHELPGGWVRTTIGDISDLIHYGYTASSTIESVGPKMLRITDIQNNNVNWETVPYCKIEKEVKQKYLLSEGDLVFARTGATVGKSYLIRGKIPEAVFASYLIRIILSGNVEKEFVYNFFHSIKYWLQILEGQIGIGQPNVNSQILSRIVLPLPPLPEQRAIVSKIEQLFSDLDNGIENFKNAQAQLKLYRQSVLKAACEGKLVPTEAELARTAGRDYEAADVLLARILKERREKWNGKGKFKEPEASDITDLPILPDGWGWLSIDQISQYVVDCLHSTAKFIPDGKYCIDTNCIQQGKILFEMARFVSEETYYERVSRLVPQADDILFAREGTIGTAVLVPQNIELCLGQRMMMFRAANGVIPLYFMWALQSQIFEKQWKAKVLGSTVLHVNIGDIKGMAISLPPIFEQRRIVAEVERRLSVSDKMEATITESLQKAESLRQSILKKAFEGKLLNKKELEKARNAPDWEPAEKLLERIKAEKVITQKNKRRSKE